MDDWPFPFTLVWTTDLAWDTFYFISHCHFTTKLAFCQKKVCPPHTHTNTNTPSLHKLVLLISKPSNLRPLFAQNTWHEQLKLTFQSSWPFTCNLVLITTLTWICLQHVCWLNSVLRDFGSPAGGLLLSLSLCCRCASGLLSLPHCVGHRLIIHHVVAHKHPTSVCGNN